jgi:hypothetical protein
MNQVSHNKTSQQQDMAESYAPGPKHAKAGGGARAAEKGIGWRPEPTGASLRGNEKTNDGVYPNDWLYPIDGADGRENTPLGRRLTFSFPHL